MIVYHDRSEEELHEVFFPSLKRTTRLCINFLHDRVSLPTQSLYHDRLKEELHEAFFSTLKRTTWSVSFATRSCIISYTITYHNRLEE